MKTATTKQYADNGLKITANTALPANLSASAVQQGAKTTHTLSADEVAAMKAAQEKADAERRRQYEVVTIPRSTDAYARFISAFNSAKIEKCGKWWDKGSLCYRYGRAVHAYWNSSDHRTDLSYFINTYITGGQSYSTTGNGYYRYLYNKQGSATAAQTRLVNWLSFFRSSYEQFRNLPEFSMNPDGEKRYIYDDTNKLCICVSIPYSATKTADYYGVRQERRSMDIAYDEVNKALDELQNGTPDTGNDKSAAEKPHSRTWIYIAAGILGFAVILKLIKKRKK